MKTQAIVMPYASRAFNTRTENGNRSFKTTNGVAFKGSADEEGDTFLKWATKNAATGAVLSLVWDTCTNVASKFCKNVDSVSVGKMIKNMPVVALVCLLVSGIFKGVSNAVDKK